MLCSLKGMRSILVYDCEIINCIPSKGKKDDSRFNYCQGWSDFYNMGVSVIGYQILKNINDVNENFSCFVNEKNSMPYKPQGLVELLKDRPYIIGFNSKGFDDLLLKANGIELATEYDLLEEIRKASFGSSSWKLQPKNYRYSLDALACANEMIKTGHGSSAPKLWQQGKRKEVIDYCLNDVRLTVKVLKLGLMGKLKDSNEDRYLTLRELEK
jgi:DEAD/DEAH box helicase domain-containing protein